MKGTIDINVELDTLEVKPEHIVVLKTDHDLSRDELQLLRYALREATSRPNVPIAVMSSEDTLETININELTDLAIETQRQTIAAQGDLIQQLKDKIKELEAQTKAVKDLFKIERDYEE